MGISAGIVGASGYAGGELLRLVSGHPAFQPTALVAAGSAGLPVTDLHPHLPQFADRTFDSLDNGVLHGCDVVFLAVPHGQSAAIAATLPESTLVVDLGADHRLTDADAWERYYGTPYAGAWVYGLPELPGQRDLIRASRRIAATGCYAVATILALAPLIAAGLVEAEDVVVVAASGTSGAGRSAKASLMASDVMGSLTPYKVGAHQHVPEIKQASGARSLSFTPVLAPMPRGILATVTARPVGSPDAGTVRSALLSAYAGEPFVHVLPEGRWPQTGATLGSNACHLQATVDVDSGRVIVVSAIDNLTRGAAGQAVQCANIALGLEETAGLSTSGVAP
jgi:N-acetyl-gamma-glutamyl-phosphate reductase